MAGFVRARIDDELKTAAAAVLDEVGLSVSDVIRVVLTRIAKEKAIPIGLFRPNALTIAAMREANAIMEAGGRRFASAEEMLSALEDGTGEEGEGQATA